MSRLVEYREILFNNFTILVGINSNWQLRAATAVFIEGERMNIPIERMRAMKKKPIIIKIILIILIMLVAYGIVRSILSSRPIMATVVGKRGGSQSTLSLEFITKDGQERSQTVKVDAALFEATQVGDAVEVTYDKDDPSTLDLI